MGFEKTINNKSLQDFENELLNVLKNDPDHRLDFDGRLYYKRANTKYYVAARNVYYDRNLGEIVFVGAVKVPMEQFDPKTGHMEFKGRFEKGTQDTEISIPLKDCFREIQSTVEDGPQRLMSKVRKSMVDKYLNIPVNVFVSNTFLDEGPMNLTALDMKSFGVRSFKVSSGVIEGINRDADGMLFVTCRERSGQVKTIPATRLSLTDMQQLGLQLEYLAGHYRKASDMFVNSLRKDEPKRMNYDNERYRHVCKAAVHVYRFGYPTTVVNALTRKYAGLEFFPSGNDAVGIRKILKEYDNTGMMRPLAEKKLKPNTPRI